MVEIIRRYSVAILTGVAICIIGGSWMCEIAITVPQEKHIAIGATRTIIDNRSHLYDLEYERCLENIRQTESYQSRWYLCPANKLSIGFGHTKKPWEEISDTLTYEQADVILHTDFNWAIDYAISFGYRKRNYEQLAVAHAIYCLGYGTVKEIIGKDFPDHILNYCRYRKDGKLIKARSIEKSRIFELELYNKRY